MLGLNDDAEASQGGHPKTALWDPLPHNGQTGPELPFQSVDYVNWSHHTQYAMRCLDR